MDLTPIAVATVAATVGLVAGIAGTAYKSRKELESEYDIDLRKKRIDVYMKLWSELKVLSLYSPPPFSLNSVEELSLTLHNWYYQDGGIFLSKRARNAYFDLQEALAQTLEHTQDPAHAVLRKRGSTLRAAMVEDIATRVGSRLADKRAKDAGPAPSNEQRRADTEDEIRRELEGEASTAGRARWGRSE